MARAPILEEIGALFLRPCWSYLVFRQNFNVQLVDLKKFKKYAIIYYGGALF